MMLTSISIPFPPEYYKEFIAKNNTSEIESGTSRFSEASVVFISTTGMVEACWRYIFINALIVFYNVPIRHNNATDYYNT